MFTEVTYICPNDGTEKKSKNVSYKINIGYNLRGGDGTITASSKTVVKCSCGESHSFLTATGKEYL